MEKKMVMVIDPRRCMGCSACVIACKNENNVPLGGFRDWVSRDTSGRFPDIKLEHRSERCNHCENAACISNCPTGASYRAEDGTVQVDRNKCTGCKDCLSACAYGARYVHPAGHIDKCTFCAHMEGSTACANVCPSECIVYGDANDPASQVSTLLLNEEVKVLKPEAGYWPKVYYRVS
jgi:Fe-S-cluster-containing dehydrogenase component